MTQQPTPEILTELKLTDQIKKMINEAYVPNGNPVVVAYVNESSEPAVSYRGSVQAYSDNQLAVWARNPEGGMGKGVAKNPNMTLVYREGDPAGGRSRAIITFKGRGRVDTNPSVRDTVYNNAVEPERTADPEKKGLAVIVDLDSVTGFMPGYRLQMRR